ncbi:hypothetical protein PFISCL1PPCAC_28511, partial [Pristionchus fissidentatus]
PELGPKAGVPEGVRSKVSSADSHLAGGVEGVRNRGRRLNPFDFLMESSSVTKAGLNSSSSSSSSSSTSSDSLNLSMGFASFRFVFRCRLDTLRQIIYFFLAIDCFCLRNSRFLLLFFFFLLSF